MVSEIRIYVEGGGDGKNTKAEFRQGMSQFLNELKELSRSKKMGWNVIVCGTRNDTLKYFRTALNSHPEALNVGSTAPFM